MQVSCKEAENNPNPGKNCVFWALQLQNNPATPSWLPPEGAPARSEDTVKNKILPFSNQTARNGDLFSLKRNRDMDGHLEGQKNVLKQNTLFNDFFVFNEMFSSENI